MPDGKLKNTIIRIKTLVKRWWFWTIVACAAALATGAFFYNDIRTAFLPAASATAANGPQPSAPADSPSPVLPDPSPAATAEPTPGPSAEPIAVEYTFGSGYYTSGTDFPEGEYDISVISGYGNVISANMNGDGINAIMGEDDESDIYAQEVNGVPLPADTVLRVSGGVMIRMVCDSASGEPLKSRFQPNTQTVSLDNGLYTAGTDFPAGVYDIVATSGGGTVYSDNAHDGGINAILGYDAGDIFELQYRNINLPEGTILTVNRVEINLVPSK